MVNKSKYISLGVFALSAFASINTLRLNSVAFAAPVKKVSSTKEKKDLTPEQLEALWAEKLLEDLKKILKSFNIIDKSSKPQINMAFPYFQDLSQNIFVQKYFLEIYGSLDLWQDILKAVQLRHPKFKVPPQSPEPSQEINPWDDKSLHPALLELMIEVIYYKDNNRLTSSTPAFGIDDYHRVSPQMISDFYGRDTFEAHYNGNLFTFLNENLKSKNLAAKPWLLKDEPPPNYWENRETRRDFFYYITNKQIVAANSGSQAKSNFFNIDPWSSFLDYCLLTPELTIELGGEKSLTLFDKYGGDISAIVESLGLGVTCNPDGSGRYVGLGTVGGESLTNMAKAKKDYWELESRQKDFILYASEIFGFTDKASCQKIFTQKNFLKLDGHLSLFLHYFEHYPARTFAILQGVLCTILEDSSISSSQGERS